MGPPRLAKFLLWLNAAVWLGFGLGYTVAPDVFASLAGATISRPDSYRVMTDVGVMMVGIALWYVYCALEDSRTRHGLISALLICGGLVVGRLIGIAVSGSANGVSIMYAGLEALDSALLVLALRAQRYRRRPPIAEAEAAAAGRPPTNLGDQ
jgi:hypothetical protein